jgi:hypothetical protein
MSRAGVAYTVGREANTTYGESMAGRLPVPPVWNCGANWNLGPVNGRGDDGKPLPMIDAVAPLAPLGSGDSKVRRTAKPRERRKILCALRALVSVAIVCVCSSSHWILAAS